MEFSNGLIEKFFGGEVNKTVSIGLAGELVVLMLDSLGDLAAFDVSNFFSEKLMEGSTVNFLLVESFDYSVGLRSTFEGTISNVFQKSAFNAVFDDWVSEGSSGFGVYKNKLGMNKNINLQLSLLPI